ncbi:MAG: DNA polymerase III subunit gamma/tau, partial [Pseudomonadota bacterium]
MSDDTDMPDDPGLDLGDAPATPYVVLARKYRPESFDDLIGQSAMVQTLTNAFATDRIAQGFMLTGVRGTGKTTTARILARALNYEKNDGSITGPSVAFDGYGVHCAEIIKSRHTDVVEMDAASNTGVDNIREIIESARYRPMVARYKVFIIDEVHMLSKGAFNALLKTLEEPPGHVKFIFATTEIRKVPVTVLSRCQRFDLRRVDVETLVPHFQKIVGAEGASAEQDALALIARAAEGSVRDGLSILDQAIAMGSGTVTADAVRTMIGLADRGRIFDLLVAALSGNPKEMLSQFDALYRDGAEPVQVLADLAEATHTITKAKAAGSDALSIDISRAEIERAETLAQTLSMGVLARAWQILARGTDDAQSAPNVRAATEMVLIRLAYASDMPSPDQLLRALGGAATVAATPVSGGATGSDAPAGQGTREDVTAAVSPAHQPRGGAAAPQAAVHAAHTGARQPRPADVSQPARAEADATDALSSFEA